MIRSLAKLDEDAHVSSFHLFRFGKRAVLYVLKADEWVDVPLRPADVKKIALPTYFEIDADIPLPDSVSLDYLVAPDTDQPRSRKHDLSAMKNVRKNWSLFESLTSIDQAKQKTIAEAFATEPSDEDKHLRARLELAEKLLVDVAGINRTAFEELRDAAQQSEGYANGIVDRMNRQLADALNFPKWWSQDSQFSLYLTLRDFHLVFTVRDRTGSDYSFSERSGGMSYFLSYFVQYLSHQPKSTQEVLLMDEPDTYLSSLGQQDLLKIFSSFANPDDLDKRPVQVVYVTHSPFLIDKNHGERIRVLEKGDGEEGTRVVGNAAHNHYEPLRSAFGAFVAETTFIGHCNLMLEGQADQVLLAGISSLCRRLGRTGASLDLNELSLVPAGGAEHIPYMVYLARGRDVDTPAVIVLLDSDDEADGIAAELHLGYRETQLVDDDLVIQVGTLGQDDDPAALDLSTKTVQEMEDLLTSEIAILAIKHLACEVLSPGDAAIIDQDLTTIDIGPEQKLFKAAQKAATDASARASTKLRLAKVAFARAVLHVLAHGDTPAEERDRVLGNFEVLFARIDRAQRDAMRRNDRERTSKTVNRLRKNFLKDHPKTASKRDVAALLEDIDEKVPTAGIEAETLRAAIRRIRSEHNLREEPLSPVEDFAALRADLEALAYEAVREVQA
nr:AAA family ATPase [Blastococcus saxobsidens]